MDITNEAQLKQILIDVLYECIDEVTQQLYDKLVTNIDNIVYIGDNKIYAENHENQPTYQFRNSWNANVIQSGNEVNGIIEQDFTQMEYSPEFYIHGSWMGDAREFLAEILNEGKGGSLFGLGWWTAPRPFWDETIKLISDGTVDEWFQSALRKRNLQFKLTMSFSDWAAKYNK